MEQMEHTMKEDRGKNGRRPVFLHKRDIVILLVAAIVAVVLWLVLTRGSDAGAVARVTIGLGDAQRSEEIALNADGVHNLMAELPVHLQVQDGAIRFVHSECPDHLCEDFGWLRYDGDWAACLPAGVVVRIGDTPLPQSLGE